MSSVTKVLSEIAAGDPHAAEQLLPLVYDELRKLAAAKLAHENPGQTLQATALMHEAYLRLVGNPSVGNALRGVPGVRDQDSGVSNEIGSNQNLTPVPCPLPPVFNSRAHFFAAPPEAVRRILLNRARETHMSLRELRFLTLTGFDVRTGRIGKPTLEFTSKSLNKAGAIHR